MAQVKKAVRADGDVAFPSTGTTGIHPAQAPYSWAVYVWALAVALMVLWAVYPGFMSYDSLHALREARGAVQGGDYPPFVSYVWRVIELVAPGPAPMLFLQNLMLMMALAAFFVLAGVGAVGSLIGLTLIALAPALLGPMLVVWKDVALSACFGSAAAVLFMLQMRRASRPQLAFLVAVGLIFCGMAYRLNAAPGALPLLVWAFHLKCNLAVATARQGGSARRAAVVLAGGVLLTAVLSTLVVVVNGYRLPDLSPLGANSSLRSIQFYDLVGITARSGVSAFGVPGVDEATVVQQSQSSFDPRHLNITLDADKSGLFLRYLRETPPDGVGAAWRRAVSSHPATYLAHRWGVFRELVGLAPREVFYPTHGTIDANEYGYTQQPGWASRGLLSWISRACGQPSLAGLTCRSWPYHLAGLVAALVCVLVGSPAHRMTALAVYASGIAYLLPQFVVTPAADLRYTHWSVLASLLVCVIASGALLSRSAGNRPG